MNRLKIKYAVAYGFLAVTAVVLIASLFMGCHVYEHEESINCNNDLHSHAGLLRTSKLMKPPV